MTPTTCTGWRIEPATLKYTAEPPRASAVSPKGVKIESSAMLPTTSSVIRSHPVRGSDTEKTEGVGEHGARRACQQQARMFSGLTFWSPDVAGEMIPAMHHGGELVEVGRHP